MFRSQNRVLRAVRSMVFVFLISRNVWALGAAVPAQGAEMPPSAPPLSEVIGFSGNETTVFGNCADCLAQSGQCEVRQYLLRYSCVAQGAKDGKNVREAGYSEVSREDAEHRAVTYCLSNGSRNCRITGCREERRLISQNACQ